jgi:hypothetical protein
MSAQPAACRHIHARTEEIRFHHIASEHAAEFGAKKREA